MRLLLSYRNKLQEQSLIRQWQINFRSFLLKAHISLHHVFRFLCRKAFIRNLTESILQRMVLGCHFLNGGNCQRMSVFSINKQSLYLGRKWCKDRAGTQPCMLLTWGISRFQGYEEFFWNPEKICEYYFHSELVK